MAAWWKKPHVSCSTQPVSTGSDRAARLTRAHLELVRVGSDNAANLLSSLVELESRHGLDSDLGGDLLQMGTGRGEHAMGLSAAVRLGGRRAGTHLLRVDVDLVEAEGRERVRELLKDGGDDLAARGQRELVSAWSLGARSGRRGRDVPGSAPRRPEVDDRGLVGCRGRVSMPGSCGIAVWA